MYKSLSLSATILNESAEKINYLLEEYKNSKSTNYSIDNNSKTFMWDGHSKWNIVDS